MDGVGYAFFIGWPTSSSFAHFQFIGIFCFMDEARHYCWNCHANHASATGTSGSYPSGGPTSQSVKFAPLRLPRRHSCLDPFVAGRSGFQVPMDWKIGRVVPVFKSGDRSNSGHYRPMALTYVAFKLLEHIVFSNIMNHKTCNNFFSQNLCGFRQGYSCGTQLFEFSQDLHTNLDSQFKMDAIFLKRLTVFLTSTSRL